MVNPPATKTAPRILSGKKITFPSDVYKYKAPAINSRAITISGG